MGRKKKFIDKKKSATFQLIARDSSDPIYDDSPGNDRVFVRIDNNPVSIFAGSGEYEDEGEGDSDSIFADAPEDNNDNEADDRVFGTPAARPSRKPLPENVRKEILELGFPDDGYNYLKHLREIKNTGGGSAYYQNPKAKLEELPRDVKAYDASRVRISGGDGDSNEKSIFSVASKTVGVRLQKAVDPDVAALLDDSDLSRFASDDEDLEEDFVVQANLAEEEEEEEVDNRLNIVEEIEEKPKNEVDKAGALGQQEVVDSLVFQNGVGNQLVKEGDEIVGDKPRAPRLLDEQFDLMIAYLGCVKMLNFSIVILDLRMNDQCYQISMPLTTLLPPPPPFSIPTTQPAPIPPLLPPVPQPLNLSPPQFPGFFPLPFPPPFSFLPYHPFCPPLNSALSTPPSSVLPLHPPPLPRPTNTNNISLTPLPNNVPLPISVPKLSPQVRGGSIGSFRIDSKSFSFSFDGGRADSYAIHESRWNFKSSVRLSRKGMKWVLSCFVDIRDWVPGKDLLYKHFRENNKFFEFRASDSFLAGSNTVGVEGRISGGAAAGGQMDGGGLDGKKLFNTGNQRKLRNFENSRAYLGHNVFKGEADAVPKRSERLAGWLSVLMVEEGYMADMRSQNKGLLAVLRGQKGWLAGCQS
uniref:Uncharacterized protein n=1 Tax=Quercus lobata TaxID=97700 RepID=A0A7N2KSK3_QUELO